jgi:hypothetical protein
MMRMSGLSNNSAVAGRAAAAAIAVDAADFGSRTIIVFLQCYLRQ